MDATIKAICTECGWRGNFEQMASAPDPFNEGLTVYACPKCLELENTVTVACDEPNCWREVTQGTPTENGYRNTCHEHRPKTTAG